MQRHFGPCIDVRLFMTQIIIFTIALEATLSVYFNYFRFRRFNQSNCKVGNIKTKHDKMFYTNSKIFISNLLVI